MNLDSLVKRGRLPWRPGEQATDLDVWHEYEIPLTGTFRVEGDTVMFTQALENSHGFSVWAYVCLRPGEAEELSDVSFGSVTELRDFVEGLFLGREAVLAIAKDGRIIDRWTRSHVGDGLMSSVEDFLNGVMSSVDQVTDVGRRVRAKLAGVEAAESELTSA